MQRILMLNDFPVIVLIIICLLNFIEELREKQQHDNDEAEMIRPLFIQSFSCEPANVLHAGSEEFS